MTSPQQAVPPGSSPAAASTVPWLTQGLGKLAVALVATALLLAGLALRGGGTTPVDDLRVRPRTQSKQALMEYGLHVLDSQALVSSVRAKGLHTRGVALLTAFSDSLSVLPGAAALSTLYGPWFASLSHAVNEDMVTQAGLEPELQALRGDGHGIFHCPLVRGWGMHRCLLSLMAAQESARGWLVVADDVLLFPWRLAALDLSRMWTEALVLTPDRVKDVAAEEGSNAGAGAGLGAALGGVTAGREWPYWGVAHGAPELLKLLDGGVIPTWCRTSLAAAAGMPGSTSVFVHGPAPALYLPNPVWGIPPGSPSYAAAASVLEDMTELLTAFSTVLHEIAVPSIATCLAVKYPQLAPDTLQVFTVTAKAQSVAEPLREALLAPGYAGVRPLGWGDLSLRRGVDAIFGMCGGVCAEVSAAVPHHVARKWAAEASDADAPAGTDKLVDYGLGAEVLDALGVELPPLPGVGESLLGRNKAAGTGITCGDVCGLPRRTWV